MSAGHAALIIAGVGVVVQLRRSHLARSSARRERETQQRNEDKEMQARLAMQRHVEQLGALPAPSAPPATLRSCVQLHAMQLKHTRAVYVLAAEQAEAARRSAALASLQEVRHYWPHLTTGSSLVAASCTLS